MATQTNTTMGPFQPYGRIEPVAPVPSILTAARPLPPAQAAFAAGAALAAVKAGEDPRVHMAAVGLAIEALGGKDMYQELREHMVNVQLVLSDYANGTHTAAPDLALDPLFAAADASWRTGIAWNPVNCLKSYNELRCVNYVPVTTNASEVGTSHRVDATGIVASVHTDAFGFYTPMECDWTLNHARVIDAARVVTDVNTAYAFGRALWFGEGLPADDTQPTLRRVAQDISVGGAAANLDVVVAALLSEYEVASGGSGGAVLHIPSVLMTGALGGIPGGGRVADIVGNYYRGPLGSVVSPGPGYMHGATTAGPDGAGPLQSGSVATTNEVYKGNATNEVWVYVTGPVEYAQSPIFVNSVDDALAGTDWRKNQFEAWANRFGIIRFDPCAVFAAKAVNYAGSVS